MAAFPPLASGDPSTEWEVPISREFVALSRGTVGRCVIPRVPHIKCDLQYIFLKPIFINSVLTLFILIYVFIYLYCFSFQK